MTSFRHRVLSVVRRIPPGQVATYGDVAVAAGKPRAARAVGNIMRDCGARDVPCHRVVAAGGLLGGYGGNEALKRSLLRAEGLLIGRQRIRNFRERHWDPRSASRRKSL
jgi:O-6-methylguanine DNA methyltransferase